MNCKSTWGIWLIAFPVLASAQLGGLGRATGSIGGSANGSAAGALSGPAVLRPGDTLGGTARATGAISGNEGLSAGRELGQSGNAAMIVTGNANLASSVRPLLPASTNLPEAATGFHDTADFMTAAHLSHNLGIPFDQMKAQTTGKHHVSMEKAVARLRPELDGAAVKENLKLAEHQSARDLNEAASPRNDNRVAARIVSNASLSSQVQGLLPSGTSVESAAAGFSSTGSFLSTVEAANQLQLPFADLKDRVTAGQSLGSAIQAMKPGMDSVAVNESVKASEHRSKLLQADASAQGSASVRTR